MVVAAVGRRNTLTADMVKPGAVVIDVGMNRNDDRQAVRRRRLRRRVARSLGASRPVPGGVGPMTITMLLVNTIEAPSARQRLNRPTPCRRRSRPEPTTNPLLDFSGLPRFDADPTRARRAGHRRAAGRGRRRARTAPPAPTCRPTTTRSSAVLDVATERLVARLGRGRPSERAWPTRRSCARPTTRTCRKRHRVPHPARRRRAAVRQVQGGARRPALGRAERRAPARRCRNALRDFVLWRRRAAGRGEGALRRDPGTAGRAAARSSPSTCSTRPTASPAAPSEDELAGVPDDVTRRARAAAEAEGHARLQAHPADARATCR